MHTPSLNTDVADGFNLLQLAFPQLLREPMQQALDTIMRELPDQLARINQAMEPHISGGLNLNLVRSTRVNDGAYDLTVSHRAPNGQISEKAFRVQWAADKAPAYYDLLVEDHAAWEGDKCLLYMGLVNSMTLARDIAIYSYGMQIPNTALCRVVGPAIQQEP